MFRCRICNSNAIEPILDLGLQPWCNDFQDSPVNVAGRFPLRAVFCCECTAVQIEESVDPQIMYGNHTYRTGSNAAMVKHFQAVAKKSAEILGGSGCVFDIGSNDGTILKQYQKLGFEVLGIEPSLNTCVKALSEGVPTLCCFFDKQSAATIVRTYPKKFDVISAANVFYHIERLKELVEGCAMLLRESGILIVQATYLPEMIDRTEFDIIYHEHLLYYRLETLNKLLSYYGLEIFECDFSEVHGGSIVAYCGHVGERAVSPVVVEAIEAERQRGFHQIEIYRHFSEKVRSVINELNQLIYQIHGQGCSIHAYGAPAKGTVLINALGVGAEVIPYALEVNPEKFGKYIPGTEILVVDESDCQLERADFYLLLSWNFLDSFMEKQDFKSGRLNFIVPFPSPRIVSCDQSGMSSP